MHINPYAIPQFLCALLALGLGIFVLAKNKRSNINQSFFLLCVATSLWLSFYTILYNFDLSNPLTLNWFRIAYCGVAFIFPTFFHYASAFLNIPWTQKWRLAFYGICVIFWFLILKTNLIVQGLYHYKWGPYPQAGPWHPFYLFVFISAILFAVFLIAYQICYGNLESKNKNQAKYVLGAFAIWSLACIDYVPNYGVELYPIGYIFTLIALLIIAYAIVKHQLMDITVVLRKSLIYSLLITSITLLYLLTILLTEKILRDLFGYRSFASSIFFATFIAVFFIPLKNRIQYFVDRYFFHGTQVEIAAQNELMRQELAKTEQMRAVSVLASGMAHEIKNPLSTIKTFSEYLPQKFQNKEFVDKYSRLVTHEVDRIDGLVNRLLDFAKSSAPVLKPTNLPQLIDEILEFLSSHFIRCRIKIVKDYNFSEFMINIDPNQFRQVFLNLFLNAIEAMKNGGTLTVETRCKKVEKQRSKDSTYPHDSSLEIVISDTGCGIEPKDLPHIFEPFFSKKDGGTGLGLSIVEDIVKAHKGTIKVESEIGKGTEFIIALPQTAKNAASL